MPKILLVEDNELNLDMLSRRLRRRGYEVCVAADGAEGVEVAQRELPDLILMDISLPVMDGYEATRILKAGEPTRHIPILGLSAHAMSGDAEKALRAGCDDYDTKPVELKRLLGKVEVLLGGSQAPGSPPPPSAAATRGRILVAGCPPEQARAMNQQLRDLGYEVRLCGQAGSVELWLAEQKWDALILAPGSPLLDAPALIRRLRSAPATREQRILLVGTVDAMEKAFHCIRVGADFFLPFPFTNHLLHLRLTAPRPSDRA